MKPLLLIAASEWRYWLRSYLVLGGALLFAALLLVTSVLTALRMEAESHARAHQQTQAEDTFLAQPDRHPHRMVHYGHYVFRAPTPLTLFDPGLDPVTGQSLFLEGHRQNSASFSEVGASADLGGLAWLTPALIYQFFAPLLIILLGHAAIVREREAKTLASLLAQGISGRTLILGKALALLSFIALLLIPMLVSCAIALFKGEQFLALLSLLGAYLCYLIIWGMLTLFMSAMFYKRAEVLAILTALWLGMTLVLPSVAVNVAARSVPLAGKIEMDLAMREDLRKLGDGHNANDIAFKKLRVDLLQQYNVERVEDLPINFRGLVAIEGEQKLTEVLNHYAAQRMANEARQAAVLAKLSWFTPTLAIAEASRALSGTDLEHYHRFLREAEAIRFDFVQGLNHAHVDKLSYQDDINRNKSDEGWLRARVGADNWQVLDTFQFQPANAFVRLKNAMQAITILLIWFVIMLGAVFWLSGRLKP